MFSNLPFDLNAELAKKINTTFSNYTVNITQIPGSSTVVSYAINQKGQFCYPIEINSNEAMSQNFTTLTITVESYPHADWIWFYANNGEFDASFDLNNIEEVDCALVILQFLINETHEEIQPNLAHHYNVCITN